MRRSLGRRRHLPPAWPGRGERVLHSRPCYQHGHCSEFKRQIHVDGTRSALAHAPAHQVERSARSRRRYPARLSRRFREHDHRASWIRAHRASLRRPEWNRRRFGGMGRSDIGQLPLPQDRSGSAARRACCKIASQFKGACFHLWRWRRDLAGGKRIARIGGEALRPDRHQYQRQGIGRRAARARRRRRRLQRRHARDARHRRCRRPRLLRRLPRRLGHHRALAPSGARQGKSHPHRRRSRGPWDELPRRRAAHRRRAAVPFSFERGNEWI